MTRRFFFSFSKLLTTAAICSVGLVIGCGGTGSDTSGGGGATGGNGTGANGAGGNGTGGSGTGGNGTGGGGTGQPAAAELYGTAIKSIVLEVDYASGAEPYTGPMVGFGDTWDLFEKNAKSLFQGGEKTLVIPHTLAEMEELDDASGQNFTTDDILAIAAKHRTEVNTADKATIYVVWLDGYYKNAEGEQQSTLGVSLWETGVIAMFKPVIDASADPGLVVPRFVEQTVLVHEFGHAAGLVNNGVSMVSEHQDEAHGSHCSNTECVMYYLNEGTTGMVAFVENAIATGDTDLFEKECLDDAQAAATR